MRGCRDRVARLLLNQRYVGHPKVAVGVDEVRLAQAVRGERILDLNLKFDNQKIVQAIEDAFTPPPLADRDVLVLRLEGALLDGTPIEGEDVVIIIKKE